jgi:hypothetical protein
MDINGLDTIVFSGGGVRGLSYAGVLLAFKDTYGLTIGSHFTTFAGASVGAFFAMVCAIDVDVTEALDAFKSVGLEAIFSKDPTWLLTNYALNNGEVLKQLVMRILKTKGLHPGITLGDLFVKTNKTLIITVVDLLTSAVFYLDHLNEGRDIPVVNAIMGSMALPPLFPPVSHSVGSKQILMMDGGLLDTFPLAKFPPSTTFGIRTSWYIDPSPVTDISSYYTRVLSILQLSMHSIQSSITETYPYVIFIDLGTIKADDTNVDPNSLVFKGYRAAISRFANSKSMVAYSEDPTKFLSDKPIALPSYLQKNL